MEAAEQFGRNLNALRREAGFTQDRLAAEVYMGRNLLSRLEQGHRVPRLDHMVLLARVIDVQIRDLLHGID
ncbi:MAG TPA: helix-turn-helix transcriptional regulator [Solirubrobacterales bacterium]|jgi:transcriptional regulator with XRE-family HTH domain|nr:helix-turn-helix transcriptional regulator [Solirubrobacterales bacterium]